MNGGLKIINPNGYQEVVMPGAQVLTNLESSVNQAFEYYYASINCRSSSNEQTRTVGTRHSDSSLADQIASGPS